MSHINFHSKPTHRSGEITQAHAQSWLVKVFQNSALNGGGTFDIQGAIAALVVAAHSVKSRFKLRAVKFRDKSRRQVTGMLRLEVDFVPRDRRGVKKRLLCIQQSVEDMLALFRQWMRQPLPVF